MHKTTGNTNYLQKLVPYFHLTFQVVYISSLPVDFESLKNDNLYCGAVFSNDDEDGE